MFTGLQLDQYISTLSFQSSSPVELKRNSTERSPSDYAPQGIALRARVVGIPTCAT